MTEPGTMAAEATGPTDCRILVVEDNARNRTLIERFLQAAGFHDIRFATDGEEGLQRVGDDSPDLVILDIVMPNMDGYAFLARLREDEGLQGLPVLVVTGLESADERNNVFRAGATDLINKPVNGVEMIARVNIHLENRLLIRRLEAYRARLEEELRLAREMQEGLLPSAKRLREVEHTYPLTLENHFETSSELGGDFWGIKTLDDQRLGVFITDFSGHGVTAALNTFRLHTLMEQVDQGLDDPASYLTTLNALLVHLIPRGQFATMFYGIIDTAANRLTYAAAAAPSPMVGTTPDSLEMLDAGGLPLGISKSATYKNREVDFPAGALLFLYSDALSETPDPEGEMLDEDGVMEMLKGALDHGHAPLATLIERFRHRVNDAIPDDLTALLVSRLDGREETD